MVTTVKRILSLDDHREFVEALGANLEHDGYESVIATDEQTALAILRTQPIDLFTQDIQHPGMGGWAFLRLLKSDPVLCHIPVVIVSAARQTSQEYRDNEHWLAGYVEKPFDFEELLELIEATLMVVSPDAAVH